MDVIDPSWHPLVSSALKTVDPEYLAMLEATKDWLPGAHAIFNAFRLPLPKTHYILFGESPYPRPESANGFAFWDARVQSLWSDKGLDSRVNRATSLRNIIKTLLAAKLQLSPQQLSQEAIARLHKKDFVQTGKDLFENFMKAGILLLNASLVLSPRKVKEDAKKWHPFMGKLLEELTKTKHPITLILFGKIAEEILLFPAAKHFPTIIAEHPYNLSFIQNEKVLTLFKKLDLLSA